MTSQAPIPPGNPVGHPTAGPAPAGVPGQAGPPITGPVPPHPGVPGPGRSKREPGTPEPVTGRDGRTVYPDPHRSWKRTGTLLGGWAAVWLAVFLGGFTLNAVADPGQTDIREEAPKTPFETARWYAVSIFDNRDLSAAEALLCSDHIGEPPKQMLEDLKDWQNSDGSLPESSLGKFDARSDTEFSAVIRVGSSSNPQPLPYVITIDDEDGTPCVAASERVD